MKGFVLSDPGLEPVVSEVSEPTASEGTTVARVLAAGVNPVDLKTITDTSLPVPRVVGNEAVVEVEGRRAYAERTVMPHGSFAEHTVVQPELTVPLPDGVSDEAALAVGIVGIASWVPLVHLARLRPGETVLVVGATGAVGRIAVQVARLLGAGRVVGTGRSQERLAELAELGVDAAVPLDDPARLQEATGGADVVFDVVYGDALVTALRASKVGARVVSAGASGSSHATLPFEVLRGRTLFTYSNRMTEPPPKLEAFRWLVEQLAAGALQVSVRTFPLSEAADAWRLQRTSPGTKLVVVPR